MRGHIRRRGNSYRLEVSAGLDPATGRYRKISRTFHGTRREAEVELRRLVEEVEGGVGLQLDPRHLTLRSFATEHFLPWAEDQGLAKETLLTFTRFTAWLDEVGDIPLAKLRPLHIEAWVRRMGHLAPSTVGVRLAYVRRLLQKAVEWRVLRESPAAYVRGPKQPRVERELMDPEVARRVLDAAAGTADEAAVLLALGCGLRRGEVFGLKWEDIDFDDGVLHVRRSVAEGADGEPYFKGPKSEAGLRTVPMPLLVVEGLRRQRRALNEARLASPLWEDHDLVCPRADGRPQQRGSFWPRFNRIRKRAGLPALRFHDLRHGYATLAGAGGMELNDLKELMGHSAIGVTADIYQRVLDRRKRRAASVIDEVMSGE